MRHLMRQLFGLISRIGRCCGRTEFLTRKQNLNELDRVSHEQPDDRSLAYLSGSQCIGKAVNS